MNRDVEFDDIRPYNDNEIPAAMQRIAANDAFVLAANYIYPDRNLDEVREMARSISNSKDLQNILMKDAILAIISKSISEFTFNGVDKLDKHTDYLFVSNHRDIVLDAMLQQYALVLSGFETAQITFGANLMCNQFFIDIGKANKMFRVERPGLSINSARDFYESMSHLSEYIRYVITEKHQSVWIAQRNGRTKDGCDRTDPAILKMFGMSFPDDKVKALDDLHIVPLSISYEIEPCDQLKVLELYESSKRAYSKKPGEDIISVVTGISSPKGRVHLEFCKPLSMSEYEILRPQTSSAFNRSVSAIIDERICGAYKLFPNNYIAHDLRYGNTDYSAYYSQSQKNEFMKRLCVFEQYENYNSEDLKELFLALYSNPVDSKLHITP